MRELTVPAEFTVGEHDNIVSTVFEHERNDPDAVIYQRLVDGTWTDVTCAQAAAQIRSTALGLIAEGVRPGDRVAIFSATRYEWAILDQAILAAGAVTVPIYETSSAEQVRWVLSDSARRARVRRDRRPRDDGLRAGRRAARTAAGAAHRRLGPQGARSTRAGQAHRSTQPSSSLGSRRCAATTRRR